MRPLSYDCCKLWIYKIMVTKINSNVSIWNELNPWNLSMCEDNIEDSDTNRLLATMGFQKQRILIRNRWFDVIHPSELVRSHNSKDGYYRIVYIQINMETGEYYIGKANRPKWSEIKRYQGSGLKFKNKFKKSKDEFVRYFIGICKTAEETEELEASIVDKDLLSDENCLNLVSGGGGTTKRASRAETREKKREYMKNNPQQFQPMLQASKKAFRSGNTSALRARNKSIKKTMNSEFYREMSRSRIKNWIENNPEEYAKARKNNLKKIRSKEVQKKRAAKISKGVSMIDLNTGEILRKFQSARAAARWLVEKGITRNVNCATSVGAACRNFEGKVKLAYGYGWRFTNDL